MSNQLDNTSILLVISGGIAAYKTLELIRLLKNNGANVRCVLTNGGSQFITPMSVAALSEEHVFTDLWSLKDESEMGHIRLSREADLIVIAPASANIIAQMAYGLAEDLASTTLLAANKPIMLAPAMNPMMWNHKATQDNIQTLRDRGLHIIGPADGDMACGETGTGRMSEPAAILDAVCDFLLDRPLKGYSALVTSGPTYERIDPVRFLGNRSSGKQGHAIACALRDAGADVTLVSGPTLFPIPKGCVLSILKPRERCSKHVKTPCPRTSPCAQPPCLIGLPPNHKTIKSKNAIAPSRPLSNSRKIQTSYIRFPTTHSARL